MGRGTARWRVWLLVTGAGFGLLAPPLHAQTYTDVTPGGAAVTASTNDGNVPANTVDDDLLTRWSGSGDGQWIQYDLGSSQVVAYLEIASYSGNTRRSRFEIQVSANAASWSTVWSGESSGTTTNLETYDIADVMARHIRLLGHGNSSNAWNSFTEVNVFASAGTPEPPTPSPTATPTPRPTPPPTATPTPTPRATPTPIPPGGPVSTHVQLGPDGRLVYIPYPNGDIIPDFSYAGYMGGGVALPTVPVAKTISPIAGDDGANIQAAIDEVSALPLAGGFRGAVLMTAGAYEVEGSISITASGVVLRGEGDGPTGTVIKAVGTTRRTVIQVTGVSSRAETGARQTIIDPYVPLGARSFSIADASGLSVGADVLVGRTPNQEWIDQLGTDACDNMAGTVYDTADQNNSTCLSEGPWKPTDRNLTYERRIVAISGNQVTIDSPIVEAIPAAFGGGYVVPYAFPGRISQVGIEYLRSESDFASATDENHAVRMMTLTHVENAWVRNTTSVYFEQGTVFVSAGARYVTVQDSQSLDHKSVITGGRRYPFSLDDCSHVLVMRCYTKTGRHDFVTGSNTPGPNVFLDSLADFSYSELGPHHRWATGSLFDRITHKTYNGAQIMGAYNRGTSGTGHGWSGAYQLFWNCTADKMRVVSPPGARNWAIGCTVPAGKAEGNGEYESLNNPVTPGSLYLQQLKDRLGAAALINIGYSGVLPPPTPTAAPSATPTPTPTPTPATGTQYEAEDLAPAATTSGGSLGYNTDAGASAGRWMSFGASGAGAWVEYTLPAVPHGTYDLKLMYKTHTNRGIHNVAVDGTVIGSTIDQYKTGSGTFPEPTVGTVRLTAGDHKIRLTVTGKRAAAGNYTITQDRFVLVPDLTAPVITAPADIDVEATGPAGVMVTFSATATDNKDGGVTVVASPPSGSTFPLGLTTVTLTAEDFAKNQSTKTFTVEVVDTRAPVLSLPDDMIIEATGPAGAAVSFGGSAEDIVEGSLTVAFNPPSGSTFPLGTTTVTGSAGDSSGNSASGGFTVTVVDTTPPNFSAVPADMTVEATSGSGAVVTFSGAARDLVSGDRPVVFNPTSGSTFPYGTTTATARASDTAGNSVTRTFHVTVVDSTAPVIESLVATPSVITPADHRMVLVTLTVQVKEAGDPNVKTRILWVSSSQADSGLGPDDLPMDGAFSSDLAVFVRAESYGADRIYTIHVEARDSSGNASTRTVTVTVPYTPPPPEPEPAPTPAPTPEPTGSCGYLDWYAAGDKNQCDSDWQTDCVRKEWCGDQRCGQPPAEYCWKPVNGTPGYRDPVSPTPTPAPAPSDPEPPIEPAPSEGATCSDMGWYDADQGGECEAEHGSCRKKQDCNGQPCQPWPHYCWIPS